MNELEKKMERKAITLDVLLELTRSSATAVLVRFGDGYTAQGHSRSLISISIESPKAYAGFYKCIILPYMLSGIVSHLLYSMVKVSLLTRV